MQTIRILLAEDHAVVRQGTRELLEQQEDLEVVAEASDGQEAVQLALKERPDVVIMDFAMPKLNGIEATRHIKAVAPGIAILVLTAHDSEQYIFAFLEAGAAGYLLKDVSVDKLVEAIRAVHAGESVLHPAITRKVINRFRIQRQGIRRQERAGPDHRKRAGGPGPGCQGDVEPRHRPGAVHQRAHRPNAPEQRLQQDGSRFTDRSRHVRACEKV